MLGLGFGRRRGGVRSNCWAHHLSGSPRAELVVPDHVLNDVELSLAVKGLFALLVASRGQPIDPFGDALQSSACFQNDSRESMVLA